MKTLYQSLLNTPIGQLGILATDTAIVKVTFGEEYSGPERPENPLTREAKNQLAAYFAGQRQQFELPLEPSGTEFQHQAWKALQKIPYGETRYYAQQASLIGRPNAIRAIGAANGANPIAIIVPCHRIIGKNGSLTGYAGGLNRKQWLLAFEREQIEPVMQGALRF